MLKSKNCRGDGIGMHLLSRTRSLSSRGAPGCAAKAPKKGHKSPTTRNKIQGGKGKHLSAGNRVEPNVNGRLRRSTDVEVWRVATDANLHVSRLDGVGQNCTVTLICWNQITLYWSCSLTLQTYTMWHTRLSQPRTIYLIFTTKHYHTLAWSSQSSTICSITHVLWHPHILNIWGVHVLL